MRNIGIGLALAFSAACLIADPVSTQPGSISVNENGSLQFSISSLVSSQEPIVSYTIVDSALDGFLTGDLSTGNLTYTPNTFYFGPDRFLFEATDSGGDVSPPTEVQISVNEVNLPPQAFGGLFGTQPNTPLFILLDAASTNQVPITSYGIFASPQFGTICCQSSNSLEYIPNAGFTGLDNFEWYATAANGLSAYAIDTISVEPLSNVPEPAYVVLLGTVLAGIAAGKLLRERLGGE